MKKIGTLLILLSAFGVAGAYADEKDEHAGHHPAGAQGEAAEPDTEAANGNDNKMTQQIKRMQDIIQRVQSTGDPQLRKELLGEHLEAMQETMKLLQRPQPEGKGKGGDPAMKGPDGDGGMKMGMMKKHARVEMRLNALEAMMKQMLEREKAESKIEAGR
jgi:hypothetical protein